MRKVKVLTSFNVPIEFELAGVGERIIATILDYIIKGLYYLTFIIAYTLVDYSPGVYFFVLIGIPVLLYNPACEILLQGQTIGMRIRKIKVISLNGKEPTIGQYLTRWLFRLIDVTICNGAIAIISISATKKGQRLGDIAAGTTVAKSDNSATLENTLFTDTEETYTVQFPEVHLLTDSDVEIIKEVLENYRKNNKRRILEELAVKVKEKLNITSQIPSPQLLDTVLKDYNHLHSGQEA